jgi:glucoamylase
MNESQRQAPGWPGIPPRWTSSAKSGVGTAASSESRVWFTISHGIVNEVYYPRLDQANTRDFGLLVADGSGFFSEEKRHTVQEILPLEQGVPGYRVTNTCSQGRYRLVKTILTDPRLDALLQRVEFHALQGRPSDYGVYALLAPHIGNRGCGNNGWIGEYKGIPMLFAERDGTTLALACSPPLLAMSCGYVGVSDGWRDISAHKRMTWHYPRAADGNIALTGELDLLSGDGSCVLALAFGRNAAEAGHRARAALLGEFDQIVKEYVSEWEAVQSQCLELGEVGETGFDLYRVSTAVLKTHEAKRFPGGMIASLSIPWGSAKGDDDLGGYHLVWPRDLVESAGGLLAAGDVANAQDTLFYLMCTQEADGHWPQNMWMDGTPYWGGVQMDEAAFPILLADALRRMKALNGLDPWPMVRRAACFLVCNGPVTEQDRWEEDGGYSPFTLAVEIAASLAAADFAEEAGEAPSARYLRETADAWNANIERWTYVTGTELAQRVGVEGHYVRIAPPEVADAASPTDGFVPIKNRPPGESSAPAAYIVSPDALALVRFGLRAADDPRILNTVRTIDATLRTEIATGPVWHRYNGDGYGEHEDGRAFDGTGIGRGWPLLAGERAHYELARGDRAEATRLLRVMAGQTSPGGLIPEQVWDAADIPERELFNGHPSGAAMPLVWAHAEYVKLLRSLKDGRVFDMPPQTVQRYQVEKVASACSIWRYNHKCRHLPTGKLLRIELLAPALIHWSADDWWTTQDIRTTDSELGIHFADLPTDGLPVGCTVTFTFLWLEVGRWEGVNFEVTVGGETCR